MGGEYYNSLAAQLHKQVAESDPLAGIEASSWLVDHQNAGQMQQNLGNTHSLLHPARERANLLVPMSLHVNGAQNVFNALVSLLLVVNLFKDSHVVQKIPGGHILVHAKLLGKVAN